MGRLGRYGQEGRRSPLHVLAIVLALLSGVSWSFAAEQPPNYPVPLFRQATTGSKPPDAPKPGTIRLLVDDGFPPFHFRDGSGHVSGLSVDLALAACAELKVTCEARVMPFEELLDALANGKGDVLISALRITPQILGGTDMTRPFYRAMARFAVLQSSPIASPTPAKLAGKRVGVVAGSAHQAWLQRYFAKSGILLFADEATARAALKTGQVDALFGDALRLIYWIAGSDSQGCCRLLEGGFVDEAFFSYPLSFLVRRDDGSGLRDSFDWALDRLQTTGQFARIFRRYVPLDPWSASAAASPPTASTKKP